MPIRAEVEGIGTLEFPDGTDPAVIQQTVKRAVAGQYQTPSQRRGQETGGDASMRGYHSPARNLMSSVAHAGLDASEGVSQIVSRAAEALGLPPGSNYPFVASPDIVEREFAGAREAVNKRLGQPQPGGVDLVRGAVSSSLVAPLMGPVGTAGTMTGRALQAARAGTVQGLAQPVTDAKDPMDFLKTKTLQAGSGAVFGGVAQPALEFGSQGIANITNAVTSRASGAIQDTSENTAALLAAQVLAQQGVKFNTLDQTVQQSIVKDVQEALKKYGGVNAAALGRKADFRALEIDPLKPWVTRDPVEWGQYKNLEMAKDAGEPLIRARSELDRKLLDRLGGLRGPGGDAYEAGSAAGAALSRKHEGMRSSVSHLYDEFRRTAPNVAADPKRLTNTILDGIEGEALGDFLNPGLRNLINDMASGKRPMTPDALYRAQQVANAEVRKGGNEGRAARFVVDGIDNELEQMGRDLSAVGPEMATAAAMLKRARAAHRTLKTQEEAIPALKDVAEGKYAAEDFFNRYILKADVKEVAAMWADAGRPELKQAARSQLVDFLKTKASGSGTDGVFRQDAFAQALASPGMAQKIRIVLGEKGLDEVRRVARVAEAAIRTPAGARYNTSGTAAEMMNLLRRSSGAPVLGPMVTEPLHKLGVQSQVSGMMAPTSVGQGVMDPFYEELLRRMRQGSGLLSPALAGGAAGELTR